jgi:hypothetical protein
MVALVGFQSRILRENLKLKKNEEGEGDNPIKSYYHIAV